MIERIARAALLVLVVTGVNLTAIAPAGSQVSPVAEGQFCRLVAVTDPTIENGEVMTGEIKGGTVVATSPGATISVRCTVQVGASNSSHNGTDSASASSSASLQAATFPSTLVSFLALEGHPGYLCPEVTVNGVTYYWDSVSDPGGWSLSNTVGCQEVINQEIFPGPFGPVLDIVFPIIDSTLLLLDSIGCPILGSLAPGVPGILDVDWEGDVYLLGVHLWDCPPYGVVAHSNHQSQQAWIVCVGSSGFGTCI